MPRSDWTRAIWTSSRARAVWEPRVQAIGRAWLRVELEAVRAGVREAALVFGEALVRESALAFVQVAPDRFAVGPQADALAVAYASGDDEAVGRLLGFPACCRAFFARTWGAGSVDTTEQMALTEGPVECNILGRWLGVRLVPHLPCSFHCHATLELARRLEPLWPSQELAWAREILSWPMEWSALHGIAEVRYPVLRLTTRTTPTGGKRVVRRAGAAYPAEGAAGLVFPYSERGRFPSGPATSSFSDNGFGSAEAMERAHRMVLDALGVSPPSGHVADLGAGNGALVDKIKLLYPNEFVGGIEADMRRAGRHPFLVRDDLKNLLRSESRFDTLIVSERRFEEIPGLEEWCLTHARQVLIYSYDAPMSARMRSYVHQA